jgi:uncharacterized protein (DUF2164 family)
MAIELSQEQRKLIIDELISYCYDELDVEIGDLKATLLLDHLLKVIGAAAYNRGVADAQTYLRIKLEDMGIDLHEELDMER